MTEPPPPIGHTWNRLYAAVLINLALSRACGVPHPALITADQLELLDGRFGAKTIAELFGYGRGFGLPSPTDCDDICRLMKARASLSEPVA